MESAERDVVQGMRAGVWTRMKMGGLESLGDICMEGKDAVESGKVSRERKDCIL